MGSVMTQALKKNSTQNLQHRSECGHIRGHIDPTLQIDCVCLSVRKIVRAIVSQAQRCGLSLCGQNIEISNYAGGERRQVGPTPSPTVGACAGYR